MSKTCIILTCEYPYITAEAFLENEMPYLSKVFDEIYIFAVNANINDIQTRETPDNVRAYPLGCLMSKMRYPVYGLRGVLCRDTRLPIAQGDIKRKLASLYARGRSDVVLRKILSIIQKDNLRIDDVVIYSYWFTDQAVTAWRLKTELKDCGSKVKAVCRTHGYDLYWNRNPMGYLPFQRESLTYLDGVYPCSNDGYIYLKEKYPKSKEKVHVARLGTTEYGITNCESQKVFLTCCNLKKLKRISLFAKAFCIMAKRVPGCKWICIGDGDELDEIRSIVTESHMEDSVVLLGRLPNQKVLDYYKTHPVSYFCNVSTSEGVPVSIMEAMSFGIPIIATDVGGSGELVCDACGKLLSSELDVDKLAKALAEAATLPTTDYQKKRRMSRKIWEERSSAEKNYSQWCEILTE